MRPQLTISDCPAQGALLNVMWQPGREGSGGGMDKCMCIAESLHCLSKTITTLLIGYTPIQNKKFKKLGKIVDKYRLF